MGRILPGRARAPVGQFTAAVCVVLALAACSTQPSPAPAAPASPEQPLPPVPSASAGGPVMPTVSGDVATGLRAPWSIVVVDAGTALVSQRDDGRILLLSRAADGWSVEQAGTVAGVVHSNEGGLMGLALAPSGDELYAMLTTATDNRVVRMPWDGSRTGPADPVFVGIPKAEIHNGGRIAFGPDGMLYVATGDAGRGGNAQDPGSLNGKILRLAPDGTVPTDNPTKGSPVFSLGHRNVQGLAFDDQGRLWASEFGAKDVDEVNLIVAGGNYGWPLVEGPGGGAGLIDPAASFAPTATASPSGLVHAEGSLWVAALRGRTLYQVPLAGGTAGDPVAHFTGDFGRLRDAVAGPDGGLWILTNNTDGRGEPGDGDDRIVAVALGQGG